MYKRPLAVTIIGCVYIAAGLAGLAYHLYDVKGADLLRQEALWMEAVRAAAIVSGVFLLLGHNWAKWVALAWMGFHVVLAAFHDVGQFAMHAVFFAAIAWFLSRPEAQRFFGGGRT